MIHFDVNMDSLREIENALGMTRDKSKTVLKSAINNTAKQTVTLLVSEANVEYKITQPGRVKKTLETKKATAAKLYAVVESSDRINELYNFSVSPKRYNPKSRPKGGYKGNVKRANRAKTLQYGTITRSGRFTNTADPHKAFTVKLDSGHITVAQREPGSRRKSGARKSHPNGEEALKVLYAPSIPNMLGYEKGVYGVVEPQIYSALQKNIQAQIEKVL